MKMPFRTADPQEIIENLRREKKRLDEALAAERARVNWTSDSKALQQEWSRGLRYGTFLGVFGFAAAVALIVGILSAVTHAYEAPPEPTVIVYSHGVVYRARDVHGRGSPDRVEFTDAASGMLIQTNDFLVVTPRCQTEDCITEAVALAPVWP